MKDLSEKMLFDDTARFFGDMTASSTHEVKNSLAIINENAGLLEDLAMMAGKTEDPFIERAAGISRKIQNQVKRADIILRRLNQFSHSMDQDETWIELKEAVEFVMALGKHRLVKKNCSIHIDDSRPEIKIKTPLLLFQQLIWRVVEGMSYDNNIDNNITIGILEKVGEPCLRFRHDSFDQANINRMIQTENSTKLMNRMGVRLEKNMENKSFDLVWSK